MSSGHLAYQGAITTAISVNHGELDRRIKTSRLPQTGSNSLFQAGADLNNHRIAKNALIVGWRDHRIAGSSVGYNFGRPQEQGFASFNGVPTKNTEDDFVFLGMSRTDFNPFDPHTPQNGIAVLRKGTASPFYTGVKDIYPGDRAMWSLPEKSNPHFPRWEGKPKEQLPPVLGPLDYAELENKIFLSVQKALAHKSMVVSTDTIDRDLATANNAEDKLVILRKNHAMASAMFVIERLVNLGILQVEEDKITSSLDNLTGIYAHTTAATQNKIKQANAHSLLWLAAKLGLVGSKVSANPSAELQNVVLKGLYPESVMHTDSGYTAELKQLYSAYSNKTPFDNFIKQLSKERLSFQKRYHIALAMERHSIERRVVGTALSFAAGKKPNTKLDIMFGTYH